MQNLFIKEKKWYMFIKCVRKYGGTKPISKMVQLYTVNF